MADVIDLVSDSETEVEEIDVDGWTAVQGGAGAGGSAAAAAAAASRRQQDEDDAAMALRLQEEEYGGGGAAAAAPPHGAAAQTAPLPEPVTELDWSRRYRQEQDADYEASLAADRRREAEARAAADAAAAEAAAAAAAAAAEAAAVAAAEAAAQDAEAAKTRARDAWLAAPEPAAGSAGVVSVVIRFADGASLFTLSCRANITAGHVCAPRCCPLPRRAASRPFDAHALPHHAGARVTRRFEPGTRLSTLFEVASALGPLPLAAPFSLATGFPRRVLARPPAGEAGDTLEACGVEGQASVMVVAAD
jgi:hypothetical protein